jgi:hypothetical protein
MYTVFKKFKFTHVITEQDYELGFKSHPKTLLQYLTAMATVHIGKSTG